MPRAFIASRGGSGVSVNYLGSLTIGFIDLSAAVFFVEALLVVRGVLLVTLMVALTAQGVHRLLWPVSRACRTRMAVPGPYGPTSPVVDTTAISIGNARPKWRSWVNLCTGAQRMRIAYAPSIPIDGTGKVGLG